MVTLIDTVSSNPLRPRHPEKVNRPDAVSPPKPDWIRVRAPNTRGYADTHKIVKENGLVTVCEEAGCPNIGECWDKKHATFMIMGDTCTRACAFCNVKTGLPGALDAHEPEHVAEATFKLGLAHIVITSVDRDDLADGGAGHFAQTIRAIRARCPPISCARTARWSWWWRPSPMSSTTISRPCRRVISACGRARATSIRSGCFSGSRRSITRYST